MLSSESSEIESVESDDSSDLLETAQPNKQPGKRFSAEVIFKDLNPQYAALRKDRALNLANAWKGQIASKLKKDYDVQDNHYFKIFLDEGGTVSADNLKRLNTLKKTTYTNKVMKDDKETTQFAINTLKDAEQGHDELANMIYECIDVQDTWDGAISKINQAFEKKAIEAGIKRRST